MLKGFDPIVPKNPRVMIVGSMPSVTSLEKMEYYGFKHNRFWKIMEAYFQMPITTYALKTDIMLEHHILLWDVIGECEREGSLDSAIKKEVVNPIPTVLAANPSIQAIFCNGRKSYDLLCRHFPDLAVDVYYLPSASNANRSIKEEELFKLWFQMLDQYEL